MGAGSTYRQIESRTELSVAEFREVYLAQQRPVVLRGFINDWPALRRWADDATLRERARGIHVPLRGYTDYTEDGSELLGDGDCVMENLTDFDHALDVVTGAVDAGHMTYTRRFRLKPHFGLWDDIVRPPFLPEGQKLDGPYFWLGPGNTNTHFHWDPLPNLFCQVRGRKRWVLLAPSEAKLAYPVRFSPSTLVRNVGIRNRKPLWLLNPFATFKFLNVFSVDGAAPDYDQHPRFRDAHPLECTVEPGDLLFVPYLWLHSVSAMGGTSISVNWFFPDENRARWTERVRSLRTASLHYGLRDHGLTR